MADERSRWDFIAHQNERKKKAADIYVLHVLASYSDFSSSKKKTHKSISSDEQEHRDSLSSTSILVFMLIQ